MGVLDNTVGHVVLGGCLFLASGFLIMLILVQKGRGGGLAGALGGMGGQSAFGTKAGDVFTRVTVVTAVIWILLCALTIRGINGVQVKAAEDEDTTIGGDENPGMGGDEADTDSDSGTDTGTGTGTGTSLEDLLNEADGTNADGTNSDGDSTTGGDSTDNGSADDSSNGDTTGDDTTAGDDTTTGDDSNQDGNN